MRRLAVAACADRLDDPDVLARLAALSRSDTDSSVRAETVEVIAAAGERALAVVMAATSDTDARVVEAAATALGEIASPDTINWLIDAALGDGNRLVREAAVASLGAIGDVRAVPALLALLADGPPQIRRRAVVALTVFDDPAIEPALRAATADRNPMVREVAEMVVGREPDPNWSPVELHPRDR